MTLRDTMIFLVSGSHRRYARAPGSYPTSTHCFDFGESFDLSVVLSKGYAGHPSAQSRLASLGCAPGWSSCHRACGVFISMVEEGDMLRMKETDMAISAHRFFGMAVSMIIDLTRSSKDLLNLSDTEFCSGVSAGALSKDMPLLER